MVSTTQIKPAPILQPFIGCYALRVINTGEAVMPRPLHAMNECYMTFFLKGSSCSVLDSTEKIESKWSNNLSSLFIQPHGCCFYQGSYVLFSVQFKSNGISAIFGIPQKLLVDTMLPSEDILDDNNRLLTEQLASSTDIVQMSQCMNTYLVKKLLQQHHKSSTNAIAATSNIVLKNKGVVSLDALAYYANMSIRTFERRFLDEVGMSPKLYARITRFYNALENKMLHPNKNFTAIAHESGYYDQAHFIKECREFANKSPEELFKYTPPPTEQFVAKVDY
ncbi:helix-turn-helix transcriptional regulator [Ilyomonas limi]|uniref:Helix-turn-helix transcriptional regulator n=1 Tax=Ilyomonas limi TaxID=2575867 RepID=A0A4U3L4Q4_9BACT|nr:helix-turn-helix transcriptional regulator [Ilyomonas limi]TKK69319.1 helix-turn-helix transcriptional regulator [Ilyomonas limi]